MLRTLRSRLTYSNVVATIAVFVALGGGAYAATKLAAHSVGTKQLKNKAVTPPKLAKKTIKLLKGKKGARGPVGAQGAIGAQGPTGGQGPTGAAGVAPGFVSTKGVMKLSVGDSKTVWEHGPLKITGTCEDTGGGKIKMTLSASSTEADSDLYGMQGTSNPSVDFRESTTFADDSNTNIDLAAPSGATLDLTVSIGVHGLGADCWVHGFG